MSRFRLTTLALALACACGDQEPAAPPGPSPEEIARKRQEQEEAQRRAAEAAAKAREERLAGLRARQDELTKKVAELQKAREELAKRHVEEAKSLPEARSLRPYLMRLIQDSNVENARLSSMERQYAELKETVAKTKVTGELKELQDKMAAVEARYWDAHSGWLASREEARFGAVEESPVKRDLDLLRVIREEWFRATPVARRGQAGGSEKKIINDAFRAWLGEKPDRKRIVTDILKGQGADGYDYTELRFYLLLSMHELALEKQNIALEKKELDENAEKLKAIEAELDALREKVAQKLAEGGGDLERYQDLDTRIKDQRKKAEDLQRAVEETQTVFASVEALKERHLQEEAEAISALEAAEKELKAVAADLKRAS